MSTSDPLSEALIATMAATLLDDYEITSLDDDTKLGRFFYAQFGTTRRELLEEFPWRIARKRVVLPMIGTTPAFGWTAQYQLPNDCIQPFRLNATSAGNFGDQPALFEVEGDYLLCNILNGINLVYIFDQINVAKWTALMGRALAGKLAMYAASNVTGKLAYFDKAQKSYQVAVEAAKVADSLARGSAESVSVPDDDGFNSVNVRGALYGPLAGGLLGGDFAN